MRRRDFSRRAKVVLLFRLTSFLLPLTAAGQDVRAPFADSTTSPLVHSIRFHPLNRPGLPPVLDARSDDSLLLSFDLFDTTPGRLRASLSYCTYAWESSGAAIETVIDGYDERTGDPHAFSGGTTPYLQYAFTFPGRGWRFLHSGNFLVTVKDSAGSVYFTARMMVANPGTASVEGSVGPAPFAEDRKFRQAVGFTVHAGDSLAAEAFGGLRVNVYQNGRTDNALTGLRPRFARDTLFDFTGTADQLFDGGSEFRQLDFSGMTGTVHVDSIVGDGGAYQVFLAPDEKRSSLRYAAGGDENGRYRLSADAENDAAGGRYGNVHFTLKSLPEDGGDLYVMGDFCRWQYSVSNRMTYDSLSKAYRLVYPMKEGRYDYLYVFRPGEGVNGETRVAEGDHSETENDYWVYVYFRSPGSSFDELLAVKRLSALK